MKTVGNNSTNQRELPLLLLTSVTMRWAFKLLNTMIEHKNLQLYQASLNKKITDNAASPLQSQCNTFSSKSDDNFTTKVSHLPFRNCCS